MLPNILPGFGCLSRAYLNALHAFQKYYMARNNLIENLMGSIYIICQLHKPYNYLKTPNA